MPSPDKAAAASAARMPLSGFTRRALEESFLFRTVGVVETVDRWGDG
jgi:hypothetical protein